MCPSIIGNCGLSRRSGYALKILYMKYFRALDGFPLMDSEGAARGLHACTALHPSGADMDVWVAKNKEDPCSNVLCNEAAMNGAKHFLRSSEYYQQSVCETPTKRARFVNVEDNHAMKSCIFEQREKISKESGPLFLEFLEWMKRVALNPGDLMKGQGPRGSKQDEAWVENCLTIASKVRTLLWERKAVSHGYLSGNLVRSKLPPALYYKELSKPNKETLEKLRANQTRALKCGIDVSGDGFEVQRIQSKWLYQAPDQVTGVGACHEEYSSAYLKQWNEALLLGYLLNNKAVRKRIPIGSQFQAHVPPWMGVLADTPAGNNMADGSWVIGTHLAGECTWPLEVSGSIEGGGQIGMGRPLHCPCAYPMSIDCVRSHVAQAREKLRLELGKAFASWDLDHGGESMAEYWTKADESIFEAVVKMNPMSMEKNFWDVLPVALPSKSRSELVSYYFNVFVLRRRAIENRVVPSSVDSDDDEKDLPAGCDIYGLASASKEMHTSRCLGVVRSCFFDLMASTRAPNSAENAEGQLGRTEDTSCYVPVSNSS